MAETTKEDLNQAGYKYYAFISYNHRDEKWAKTLQSRLRRYRLPSVARTELGGDIRIDPVFRYKTNLSVAPLREKIKEELDHSKCLIVICSPNSAKPNIKGEHWVNDEVKRFIALGRVNRIVPVIVDGIPNTGDERECFPPALRETEISAVELKRGTRLERRHEFLRLVAKLLDLEPAQLIKEDEEELRRERIIRFLCWLPAILLGLAGMIFAWDALRPVENYYADYVDSYGLPEGIFPLAKDELRGRNIHYRFEYRGIRFEKSIHADSSGWSFIRLFGCQRVLRRVVQASAKGFPKSWDHVVHFDRPPIQEFVRYENDVLREIVQKDESGRFKRRLLLSDAESVSNGAVEFRGVESSRVEPRNSHVHNKWCTQNQTSSAKTRIAQYRISRDGNGRQITVLFFDVMGRCPVSDCAGVYGVSNEVDVVGRSVAMWYLEAEGDVSSDRSGVTSRKLTYDGMGLKRIEYLDSGGRLTRNHQGWMACESVYDEYGNEVLSIFLDSHGGKMISSFNFAECRREFVNGNCTSESLFDCDGSRAIGSLEPGGWHKVIKSYNESDKVSRESYFDLAGKPVFCEEGFASCQYEYNDEGQVIVARYFDEKGKLANRRYNCSMDGGYCEIRCGYDEQGRCVTIAYYDEAGALTLTSDRFAYMEIKYDKWNRLMERSYFGSHKEPVMHRRGLHRECFTYDQYDNKLSTRFYGTSGEAVLTDFQGAGQNRLYDEMGNCIQISTIGIEGRPVSRKGRYPAVQRMEYDDHGELISRKNFDANGKRYWEDDCASGYRYIMDSKGNCCSTIFIDEVDNPVTLPCGYAEIRRSFSEKYNRQTSESYFDKYGEATTNAQGVAKYVWTYDERRNRTSEFRYGVDGKLCLSRDDGCAGTLSEFDLSNREIRRTWIGKDGKPKKNNYGYAEWRCRYDKFGEVVRMMFYDEVENPCLASDGCVGWFEDHDSRGHLYRRVWLGKDGKPMCNIYGYAELRCNSDARGNWVEAYCYNENGKPLLSIKYDEKGREKSRIKLDGEKRDSLIEEAVRKAHEVRLSMGTKEDF